MGKGIFNRKNAALVIGAFLFFLVATAFAFVVRDRGLVVDVFDVGQGDAILVTAPTGERVLVDGGPDGAVAANVAGRLGFFNRTLDLVVATHPQADHITGLLAVLDRFTVRQALLTVIRNETPEYAALREAIAKRNIPTLDPAENQRLTMGDRDPVTIDVLWPNRSYEGRLVDDPNDISIVFRLTYGETRFLFTGDATAIIEEELVQSGVDLKADVLKVGHHGSDTGTTLPFLDAVDPSIAVISVGRNNRFGHPSRRVLRRLERKGVSVYRTDTDGDIRITSDGKTIRVAH